MTNLISLLAGAIFAVGLIVSGMANPAKVLNFLDVTGQWDPSLAVVMLSALAVTIPGFLFVQKRNVGWRGVELHLPTTKDVDRRLVAGSMLFGIGWGLAGLCPGPALVSVSTGGALVLTFVAGLAFGMFCFKKAHQ